MNITLKHTLLAGALTVLTLSGAIMFSKSHADNQPAAIEKSVAYETPASASFGLPVRLKIPAIKLDAVVESVGLTSGGAMDVPKNTQDVGWFNLGPQPGNNGTAVIDGHYGLNNKKASAFDDLYKLRAGDKIYVQDDMGATTTFIVRGNRRYDPKADASAVFGTNTGDSHLNLITCEGVWDPVMGGYVQRLVVFTDRE